MISFSWMDSLSFIWRRCNIKVPAVGEDSFFDPLRVPGWVWKLYGQRLTGEEHTHLFNINFTWHGSLHEEMETLRNHLNWVSFCPVWQRVDSCGYDRSVVCGHCSELREILARLFRLFSAPPWLWRQECSFPLVDLSQESFMASFRGEEWPSWFCHFSQTPSVENI